MRPNRKIAEIGKHVDSSSAYKGVCFHKKSMKWCAQIYIKKQTHLGLFASEREAAEAYNTAAVLHYKKIAKLNKFEDL